MCSWLEREGGSCATCRSDNMATKITSSSAAIRTQENGRFEGLIKNCETQRKHLESGKNEMKGIQADNQAGEKSDNQRHSSKIRAANSTARMSS